MMASFPKTQVVQIKAELGNAVVVRPGDKLIVARSDRISMQDGERLKARIGELLPGVEAVIISECTGLAVYRDEPTGIIPFDGTLTAAAERRKQARIDGTWQP